jgi:acyl-CoA hydrolase
VNPDDVIATLPQGARILVQGGAGESRALAHAVQRSTRTDLSFTGVWLPGVNTETYGAERGVRVTTFFMTPQLKSAGASVEFLPLGYSDIREYLLRQPFDAVMTMLSTPDAAGLCSFGPAIDFIAELWSRAPLRVAHLNPLMPHTNGHPGMTRDALTHVIELEEALFVAPPARADEVSGAIATHFATLVGDGATLQAGIGKLPGACLGALKEKRDLRIYSGLIGDWALDLLDAGALADAPSITGLALGSTRLYQAIASPRFEFRPVSHTHAAPALAKLENFVTLNSAVEVDLLGQSYSEAGPDGLASGPGGALDFARGAKLAGGLRVIVLPAATGGGEPRIVAPNSGKGPVTLSRFDVDVVITEHGAADLRGVGHEERARRLIAIADERHRAMLLESWRGYCRRVLD